MRAADERDEAGGRRYSRSDPASLGYGCKGCSRSNLDGVALLVGKPQPLLQRSINRARDGTPVQDKGQVDRELAAMGHEFQCAVEGIDKDELGADDRRRTGRHALLGNDGDSGKQRSKPLHDQAFGCEVRFRNR